MIGDNCLRLERAIEAIKNEDNLWKGFFNLLISNF